MTAPAPEDVRSRRERATRWHGLLADENVQHVADRIGEVLRDRRYTFVSSNAELGVTGWVAPSVRTSCQLNDRPWVDDKPNPRVYRIGDDQEWSEGPSESCGLTVSDTGYVWGLHSRHATEAEAREDQRADRKTWTAVSIDNQRGRIEIKLFNGPGEMLHWVIAVEEPAIGLEESTYDLERLDQIARTPDAEVTDYAHRFWRRHPLAEHHHARFGDTIPVLVDWLKGHIE